MNWKNNDNKQNKRIIACVLALCLFLILIFSESFLADHIHHDCTGEDCPICAEMHVADGMIRTIGAAIVLFTISVMVKSVAQNMSKIQTWVVITNTPVKLKVRMDD